VRQLKVGPGTDPQSEMGPLVTRQHFDKVKGYVDTGVSEGAKFVVDGRDLKLQGYEGGYYLGGCVFDQVKPEMRIYKEEIFGPVLAVVRVPDYNSAVGLVNGHEFGNGTAIFTRDGYAISGSPPRSTSAWSASTVCARPGGAAGRVWPWLGRGCDGVSGAGRAGCRCSDRWTRG